MSSYIENTNNGQFYIAEISAVKCKTSAGFIKEMIDVFCLPGTTNNINDVSGYIFSRWLGYEKIKIIITNSQALKKDAERFREILELLNNWREYWEMKGLQNKFIIEIN